MARRAAGVPGLAGGAAARGVAAGLSPLAAALAAAALLAPQPAAGQAEAVPGEVVEVPGLAAPVEILVDRWGVPHIYAGSRDDLFFAQGWNAARDRLWQLDLWKRRGEGTLAEVLGPAYVEQDRAARLLLYRGDMHSEWLAYASDTKRVASAFAAGVNAYVRRTGEEPDRLPLPFAVLGYRPAPWTPETALRIRSHGLLRNAERELERLLLLREHGPAALAFRDRLEPAHELVVPDGLDLAALPGDALDSYRLGTGPARLPAPEGESAGSNNWALAPSRTASGRPILANDPHRTLAVPSLRYLVHLSAPGLDVIGAGEPALPGISIGHNGRIAFGLTVFAIDQEDLYVYTTRPGRPDEYWYRDRWEPMEVVEEAVAVKGSAALRVRLRFTRHGPVLYRDPERNLALALRAAWLEPGMAPYLASLSYLDARDWDGFLAAMNRWGVPGENQLYADVDGNIGWKPGGLVPIREGWDGLLPVPGDGRYEWSGYRDGDELPSAFNPERGWLATANQMNLPPGYSVPIGYEWSPSFRYRRLAEVLEASRGHTLEDSQRLQADRQSLPARRLVPLLADVELPDAELAEARRLLLAWDRDMGAGSAAAALFALWREALGPELMEAAGLSEEAREAVGRPDLELVLRGLESPRGRLGLEESRRDGVLRDALREALAAGRERLGGDPGAWRWGDLHRALLRHPLADRDPARFPEIGPAPRGGDGYTVGLTHYASAEDFLQTSGASFRMVLDVGDWDRSVAMNAPGQSGDPRSPHYDDLFPLWARDEAFPLLYTRERVEEATVRRIELRPAP